MNVLEKIGIDSNRVLVFENTYFSLFLYLVCDDGWKEKDFLIFGDRIAKSTLPRLEKYATLLEESEQFMPKPMPKLKHGVLNYFKRKREQHKLFSKYELCIGNAREVNNWTIRTPRVQIEDGTSTRNALVYGDRTRGLLGILTLKEPKKMAKVNKFIMAETVHHPLKQFADKIEVVDFFSLWEKKSLTAKAEILDVLDVDAQQFNSIDANYSILFTQPWSEITKGYSEENKIAGYKKLVEDMGIEEASLVIKPHPREQTDYSRHFAKAIILKPSFPSELMPILNVKVNKVISLNSTAGACFNGFCREVVYARAPSYFKFPKKLADHINNMKI